MADKIAIRDAYGEALAAFGEKEENIVVLESDVGSSSKSILFGQKFPGRYYNVGIAEGNMVAMGAGFATTGMVPFVNTFAVFMASRAADPVRSLVSYMNLNVKLAGAYAGLSAAYDGATHHAIEDISFMRALPNMTVICVADAVETKEAVKAAAAHTGPVYLRLSRASVPCIFNPESYKFELGKGILLTKGFDVTIVATGYMTTKALEAASSLKTKGISARVVHIHTIKPIDKELIVKCAKETGAIVTAEEHSIHGGLGSAVAEVTAREHPVPMAFVGVEDRFTESGDYEQLLQKYGLSAENIEKKVLDVLYRKNR